MVDANVFHRNFSVGQNGQPSQTSPDAVFLARIKNYSTLDLNCSEKTDRIWSEPVPKLSSPHNDKRPASIRLPKNFHPVGTSKNSLPIFEATLTKNFQIRFVFRHLVKIQYLSMAPAVGIDLANPLTPVFWKYGIHSKLAANTANESDGVTKNAFLPKIMFRSYKKSENFQIYINFCIF